MMPAANHSLMYHGFPWLGDVIQAGGHKQGSKQEVEGTVVEMRLYFYWNLAEGHGKSQELGWDLEGQPHRGWLGVG